jgi:hypothetical protein
MKTKNLALALLMVSPLGILLADDVPKAFALARYQTMMDRSPFAIATAVAAPAPTPNFAKDLYVANAAHSKDGDFVTIASSADKSFKKYISTGNPDDGYTITGVEWSEKIGGTKVTIAKDGQTATLGFNEALLKQTAGPQQPPGVIQAQPIVPPPTTLAPPVNLQQQRPAPIPQLPAPIPQLPTPPPRVRGVIPKNPNVAPAPTTAAPTPEVEL